MREFYRPDIGFEPTPQGMQITSRRPMTDELTHVRITQSIFPAPSSSPCRPA
jgi:phthalate 4,5-dioxygenase